jgi:hypothetical protein
MADLLKKLNLNGTEYELGMSSAERAHLEGIEAGAQVNKLEGVQVDGTDLSISGKKVNINLATPIADAVSAAKGELNGTISGIDGRLARPTFLKTAGASCISRQLITHAPFTSMAPLSVRMSAAICRFRST